MEDACQSNYLLGHLNTGTCNAPQPPMSVAQSNKDTPLLLGPLACVQGVQIHGRVGAEKLTHLHITREGLHFKVSSWEPWSREEGVEGYCGQEFPMWVVTSSSEPVNGF